MAIELLISQKSIFHKPRHDLESVFFVLVYLCTNLSGPGAPRLLEEIQKLKSLPITAWFSPTLSIQQLGIDKLGDMLLFDQRILPYFSPYFQDLQHCALELCKLFFPTMSSLLRPETVLHDAVIKIFDDTLKQLPAVKPPFAHSSHQRKCSLGIHDNTLNYSRLKKTKIASRQTPVTDGSTSGIHTSTSGRGSCASASSSNRLSHHTRSLGNRETPSNSEVTSTPKRRCSTRLSRG